jgi:signal transduction histidine kinase
MTTITTADHEVTLRPSRLRQLGIDSAYVLLGFPLGTLTFVLMIAGLSVGLSLLVFTVGLAVFTATLYVARGFAELERARIASVLNEPRARVRYRAPGPNAGFWRRILTPLGDVQYWLDAFHGLLRFPISVFTFCLVVTWWSVALGGITYPLWEWSLPRDQKFVIVVNDRPLTEILGFQDNLSTRIVAYLGLAVFFAITLPLVTRACALLEAYVAKALLNGVAGLRDQVADLAEDRDVARARTAAAVSAEATALRRLERDLHDGPQQRLVRLAVDLGRAQQQIDNDPAAARATVDEALAQARETLNELRSLSRGIAPPILTDRGLGSAIAALAARSAVPVEIDLSDLGRFDAIVEQTAYFAVAEALTNVNKHGGAQRALVQARVEDGRLRVTVTDDGRGGAHLAKGHGLAGLLDRLHAAGGELWVSSPDGGPTKIMAEVPVAGDHR